MEALINEEWLLTDDGSEPDAQANSLCLVYVGEQHLRPPFLTAAIHLSGREFRLLFPGYAIEFHQTPSPGFCITPSRGWDRVVNQQTQSLAQQILWEVQRVVDKA